MLARAVLCPHCRIIWLAGTHSREHSGERLVRLFLSSAFPFGLTQTLKNKSGELLKIGMGDYNFLSLPLMQETLDPDVNDDIVSYDAARWDQVRKSAV